MKKNLNLGKYMTRFSFGYAVCAALLLVGCGGRASPPPVKLSSIAISPGQIFIGAGTKLNLSATGKYSNGTTADLTSQVTWTSADLSVASISSTGVVSAVAAVGAKTTITAALSGVTSLADVTITSSSSIASTYDLATGRFDHTATLLANGKVLVTGGYDATGALTSSELYDPNTGMWSATGSLNTKRGDHTAVLLLNNGLVLAVGGVDGIAGINSNDPTTAELYDPASGLWNLTSSLAMGRSYHTVTLLADGRVLVVGGENPTAGFLSSAEIYDPATPTAVTWTAAGNLATARYSHTATLLQDGKVLVTGGYSMAPGQTIGSALVSTQLYDPVAATWSTTGDLANGRYAHTATLLGDGTVLVVGGSDSVGNDLKTAEIYHPTGPLAGTWTTTGSLGVARYNHIAILMPSGQVQVFGGTSLSNTFLSSVELYDPTTGTWSGAANLQTGRVVFTATLLAHGNPATDGKVLVTGGDGVAGTLSSVELHN